MRAGLGRSSLRDNSLQALVKGGQDSTCGHPVRADPEWARSGTWSRAEGEEASTRETRGLSGGKGGLERVAS